MNFKKNFWVYFVTCICCLLVSDNLFSQDVVTKKDGEKIKIIIKEVSDTEIKYVDYRDVEGDIFVMDRSLIKEIKFSYGEKIKEEDSNQKEDLFKDNRNQNIKLNLTGLVLDFTLLTYERAFNPSSSLEVTLGIPGLGFERNGGGVDELGAGLSVGYKVKVGSIFKKEVYQPRHVLDGGYFRVKAGYFYSEEDRGSSDSETINSFAQVGIEFGKQWIVANRAALDLYIGVNYFGGSTRLKSTNSAFDDFIISDKIAAGDILGSGLFGNYGNAVKKKKKRKK